AFEFQLHEVGPQVFSGLVVHPFDNAKAVLQEYRKALETAPDELTCWVVMRQAPPLPFLPAAWQGKEVLVLAMGDCGKVDDGVAADETGFRHRGGDFVVDGDARCRGPDLDGACREWASGRYEAAKCLAAGTAYVNFMPGDEADRVDLAYGGHYRRLLEIQQRY